MLRKAWPLGDVANEDEDDKLLKHLLTWPTWPGFLQFFGKNFLFYRQWYYLKDSSGTASPRVLLEPFAI